MSELAIHLEIETDQGNEVLANFVALSLLNPEEVLWAIHKSTSGSHDAALSEVAQESFDVVTELLDITNDGFMIDYRKDFLDQLLKPDEEYRRRLKELSKTENKTPQREQAVRTVALRGLELYVLNQGLGMQ